MAVKNQQTVSFLETNVVFYKYAYIVSGIPIEQD